MVAGYVHAGALHVCQPARGARVAQTGISGSSSLRGVACELKSSSGKTRWSKRTCSSSPRLARASYSRHTAACAHGQPMSDQTWIVPGVTSIKEGAISRG